MRVTGDEWNSRFLARACTSASTAIERASAAKRAGKTHSTELEGKVLTNLEQRAAKTIV